MKTKNYIQKAEECLKLLNTQEKLKASPFFETHQMAFIEANLQRRNTLFFRQLILKPALIGLLIFINVSIVNSYLHRVNIYVSSRNAALIELSDNYLRTGDYYFSSHH